MINSVLAGAFDWTTVMSAVTALPVVAMAIGALVGFVKGFRKISWGGVAWMVAVNVYAVLLSVLQSMMGELNAAVPVVVAAVVCSTVSLLLFALLRLVIYPREKALDNRDMQEFLRREDRFRKIEQEELDELDDSEDEDELEKLERMQERRRKKYLDKLDGRPGLLSRLIGAAIVGLDFAFILGVFIDSAVVLISSTPLATGVLADLCATAQFQTILGNAEEATLDYLLIGAFMCSVYKGYQKGVLAAIYSILAAIAMVTSFSFGFFLSFSSMAEEGQLLSFIGSMSESFAGTIESILGSSLPFEIPQSVYLLFGKIGSGLLLSTVFEIGLTILVKILRRAVEFSLENAVFHVVDGVFGVFSGIIICVILWAVLLFGLQVVEAIGWYAAGTELFTGTSVLSVCYEELGVLVQPWVDQIVSALPF